MHVFPQALIDGLAQIVLVLTLILLLFLPVWIVSCVDGTGKRLGVILLGLTAFLAVLSLLGRPKTVDPCVAGAT